MIAREIRACVRVIVRPHYQCARRPHEGLVAAQEIREQHPDIGEALFLSTKTIATHIRQIFFKLDIAESPESHRRVLAVLAFLQG